MKNKAAVILSALVLILAVVACQFPQAPALPPEGQPIIPVNGEPTPTQTSLPPTVTPTEEALLPFPVIDSPVIYEIAMFTPTQGWAMTRDGNYLLFTQDGGETWLDVTPVELQTLPPDILYLGIRPFFLDEKTAWFTPFTSDVGTLYHTRDGGVTWQASALPFGYARYFFLDVNVGFALVELGAGAGSHYVAIHRTEDGGQTWTEVFSHEPGEMKSLREGGSKNGVTFLDVDHGWIGGNIPMEDHFYLYATEDGGTNWALETDITLPSAYAGSWLNVEQPFFITSTSGYLPVRAMSPDDNRYLLIYRSDDAGATWSFQNAVQDGNGLDFYSLDEGYVAAETSLFKTMDGGLTWSVNAMAGIPAGEFILKLDFVDDQHGWVITTPDDYTNEPLKLYRTEDGGATWTQLLP